MAPSDRERLLGLQVFPPPEGLRARSEHGSAGAYLEFLRRAQREPEAFWLEQAAAIPWIRAPEGLGGPGAFFPAGSLNLANASLEGNAKRDPGAAALLEWNADSGRLHSVTLAELRQQVGRLSARLHGLGLAPGQRVLLAVPPSTTLVASLLAAWRLGLVCVPCDPSMGTTRLDRRAEDTSVRATLVSPDFGVPLPQAQGHRVPLAPGWESEEGGPVPDSPAAPVGAMHPALVVADSAGRLYSLPSAGLLLQARVAYRHLLAGRGGGDRLGLLVPAHHASFAAVLLGTLSSGGQLALIKGGVNPGTWMEAVAALRARVWLCRFKSLPSPLPPPPAGPADPGRAGPEGGDSKPEPSLPGPVGSRPAGASGEDSRPELLVVEGEALEPAAYLQLRELFSTHVTQVLSRPESGGFLAGPGAAVTPVRPASVALPAPGVDLAVVDERGEPCPPAHGGVVALRRITPGMPLELQRQKPPLTVGVRARQDREGRLWTMGDVSLPRSDEDALALPEQEAVIAALPGVDGVAVVRYTDGAGVPRSKAFIKLQGGEQALEEIRRTLQRRFGARAVPDGFQVVAELPYSRTGKLLRSVLRRIASGELDGVEELSSLVDPALLRGLVGGTEPKA